MRRALANACLMLGSFAFCVLALEASFRRFLPMAPLPRPAAELPAVANRPHFEPSIFARNVIAPSAHVVHAWTGAHYPISAQGYRGSGFAWQKRDGVTRIVVYGGSAAFDVGRSGDDDWPSHAGRLLATVERPVEVINAGVPGHASFDNLGCFLAEGHRLGADYVLLYHGWNDIKYFPDSRPLLRQFRPYRVEADPLARPRGRLDAELAERSHLYRFARLRWLVWNYRDEAEGRIPGRQARERRKLGDTIDPAQVRQFELIVATFVDLVRNSGAEPVLITEARLPTRATGAVQRARIHYDFVGLEHDALVAAYEAVDAAIGRVAREKQVLLIDANRELGGVDAHFLDHVHLTAAGSDALAKLVAERMQGVLERSAPRPQLASAGPSR